MFPNVEIKGGVNYFLLQLSYVGECNYTLYQNDVDVTLNTYLDPLDSGVVIRDSMALKIVGKVTIIEGNYFKNKSFISMVSPKHYFDKGDLLNLNSATL